ncbi:YciI family protein [Streptomyces abikoensis]
MHADEETLGGWFIVDVADRKEAAELAKSLPTPETIEIRPILESA